MEAQGNLNEEQLDDGHMCDFRVTFCWRKKLIQYIFRQIVLIQYILFFWEKRVICTPERVSARENNRKATNSDRGTRAFVFVG